MKIKLHVVDTILEDVEEIRRRVSQRAVEIFRERRGAIGQAVDDWLQAERETVWRAALEVLRTKDAFVVRVAAAGLESRQLDVRVTPTELLVAADVHHADHKQDGEVVLCEFASGPLFRSYRFPEPVDPARVTAEYRNGLLRVTAPLAKPSRRVTVRAT